MGGWLGRRTAKTVDAASVSSGRGRGEGEREEEMGDG